MSLPTKDPAERKLVEFPFAADLAAGATISSATVSASVAQGEDASPAAVLDGTPSVSGSSVFHMVQGGVANVSYKLRCLATDSTGQVHLVSDVLPVKVL